MAFTELLSSSFLFSIAIIIILIGLIFSYVSYRMSEQDHKISSMLGLITTMAEEMQFFRSKLSKLTGNEHHHIMLDPNNLANMVAGNMNNSDLISVSDGYSNEEDPEDDLEEDTDASSSQDEEDDYEEDEDDEEEEEEDVEEDTDIKILNISGLGNDENNLDTLDMHNDKLNIKSIHLEEPIDIIQHELTENISSHLKTISIVDLEETNKKSHDYKKMSLNKLREVAIERGIVQDASKLKKNEILKLLGDE